MISLTEALGGAGFLVAPWLTGFLRVNLFFQFRNRSLAAVSKFLCSIASGATWSWVVIVEGTKDVSSLFIPWGWMVVLAVVMLAGYWLLWMLYHERTKQPRARKSLLAVVALALFLITGGMASLAIGMGGLKVDMQTERLAGNIHFPSGDDTKALSRITQIYFQAGYGGVPKGPYHPASSGKFIVRIPRNSEQTWLLEFECQGYESQTATASPGSELVIHLQKQRPPSP